VKVFVDLFAGLGGASQAFYDHPEWHVIRLDNEEFLLEHTQGLTICDLSDTERAISMIEAHFVNQCHLNCEKLVIWASPPCQQYSFANAQRSPDDFDHTLVLAALEIIEHFQPDAWIIENVKGAIEDFNDIIGHPWRQRINAFYLWGEFGLLAFKDVSDMEHKKLDSKGSRLLRPNMRALVPYPVSMALLNVYEHQRTLLDWMDE
jgi:site-specific DNA-cytosine methylase